MEQQTETTCPRCGMPVYDEDWLSCPMCGESLDVSAGFISGMTKGPFRTVGIMLALLVLYCFLWWLI
jgi:hypothetical protein